MPRSEKIKRRHKSTSPSYARRSQNGEKSPVLSGPRSVSPSLSHGQYTTPLGECRPSPVEVQRDDLGEDEASRKRVCPDAGGQGHHDFNYTDARTFYKMSSLTPSFQAPQPQPPLGPMHALHDALLTGEFSDMTILCGPETFNVHRIIVCTQSQVLARLYSETNMANTLDLSMDNVSAVAKMLEYLYKGDYSDLDVDRPPSFGLFTHTATHALGVKYNIRGLMALAANKFAIALRRVSDLEVYFQSIHEVYSQLASPFKVGSQQQANSPQAVDSTVAGEASQLATPASSDASSHHDMAAIPISGVASPEALALRIEVVNAAITELSKILAEPLVMARFHRVSMDITQFHIDLLATLAAERERGWIEASSESELSVGRQEDDATGGDKGVSVTADTDAGTNGGGSRNDGDDSGAMADGGEIQRGRDGQNGAIRDGVEDEDAFERDDEGVDHVHDGVLDRDNDNDNGTGDVILSCIRCDVCEERGVNADGNGGGDYGFEIKVVCKGCREFCRFRALRERGR